METGEGIEKLFFELSSENRLTILRELQTKSLKMQEIAQRLDVTATEVFRQLQRMSEAFLVQRQPEGTFTITPYGRLVLHLSSSFEFLSKHRAYFLNHDIGGLPTQFVSRIGELAQTNLIMDTVESINKGVQVFLEAEHYAWGLSERGRKSEHVDLLMNERLQKGLQLKLLIPETYLSIALSETAPTIVKNVEVRGISEIPVVIVVSEKEAIVCFQFIGGRIDYASFNGKDPAFLNWAKDLFLYYWGIGKRF